MNQDATPDERAATLRQRAEAHLQGLEVEDLEALSPKAAQQLLHELRVHQIELEMQNEELRRAQAELEASRARYFDLYDLAPVGHLTVSESATILETNLTAATLLGTNRSGLIGQPLSRFILAADQDVYYHLRQMLFKTQRPQVCELRLVRSGGGQFWARVEAVVTPDEAGQMVCRATVSDVTVSKQAEEALRLSAARLAALVQLYELPGITSQELTTHALESAVDLTDSRVGFLGFVNPDETVKTAFVWSRQSMAQCAIPDKPAEFAISEAGLWAEAIRQHRPVVVNEYAQSSPLKRGYPKGHMEIERLMVVPILAGGRVVLVGGVGNKDRPYDDSDVNQLRLSLEGMWQIVQRQQAEEALRASQANLMALIENTDGSIWSVDRDCCLIVGNSVFHQNTRQWRGRSFDPGDSVLSDDFAAPARGEWRGYYDRALRGERFSVETQRRFVDVSRHMEYRFSPILTVDGAVAGVTVFGRDITEHKRVEAALERSNQDLEQFANLVSHDLQAPLRAVSGYLSLVAQRCQGQLDAESAEFVQYAVDEAARMRKMIQGLLDLSRVSTRGCEFTPTDCEALLAHTLHTLQFAIEDNDAVVTHDPLPTVLADERQLSQVFQNLIANALKFRGADPPRVHIWAEQEADEWMFAVRDHGIGLDPAQAQRLFRVFQRLHTQAEYPGLGIGLAICKRIVERHGGRIWVESEPGQGATFCFTVGVKRPRQPPGGQA